jgi:hypothetical protein
LVYGIAADRGVSFIAKPINAVGRGAKQNILHFHTATAEYFLQLNCSFGALAAPVDEDEDDGAAASAIISAGQTIKE